MPNQPTLKKFVGMSLYVAETIDADILADYPELKNLAVQRIRPKTSVFSESDLAKMRLYKEKRDEMRNG